MKSIMDLRKCPCCGYKTLQLKSRFETCYLCDWDDDGQDDNSKNELWMNEPYSLSESRKNFIKYLNKRQPDNVDHYLENTFQMRKLKHRIMYILESIDIKENNVEELLIELNNIKYLLSRSEEINYHYWKKK